MPAKPDQTAPDCEFFCRVVDNFGDIGVCWRLARALAARGQRVRLWVDHWPTLQRLCPAAAGGDGVQHAGVELRHWCEPFPAVIPARLVIEAFACELPAVHLAAMAQADPQPAWLNLEYLSAEDWVADCHLMASPHPRLPLVKHFFFPGFAARTGGLPREPGLLDARRTFQGDAAACRRYLAGLGGVSMAPDTLCVSLFAYAHGRLGDLLQVWAGGVRPLCLLVPEGRMVVQLADALGVAPPAVGAAVVRDALTVCVLPFSEQEGYDRLLWACDLNFVRGEDSFVRAQWAARPFVWQIYRQQEDAHQVKLEAFLQRYLTGLTGGDAAAVRRFWRAWNELPAQQGDAAESPAEAWPAFAAALPRLRVHAQDWCAALEQLPDLLEALAQFPKAAVKS